MQTTAVKSNEAPSPTPDFSHLAQFHEMLVTELRRIQSTRELTSHPVYKAERKILEEILSSWSYFPPTQTPSTQTTADPPVHVLAWNVERGMKFDGIAELLQTNPLMAQSDIILLNETDFGMARSGNRHVAKELGQRLNFHTVFAPAFFNLDKGNGAEATMEGDNDIGIQGHAILSRYPLTNIDLIPIPNTKDPMAGKERQIGREQAIIATAQTPNGPIDIVCVHLAAHSSRQQRVDQMKTLLKGIRIKKRTNPILIGGDWNTTTYNAHKSWRAILGFWRRVLMGVRHVMRTHYPYPERYFEKRLFRTIEKEGFTFDGFNVPGGCTLHYDFNDGITNLSLKDWIPNWCFYFIEWSLKPFKGICSFKIDWFAAKGLKGHQATIINDLPRGRDRISDHDPIYVEVAPT